MSKTALPNVCVLLSTYNGQNYVAELIDSILNQHGVDVTIIIRDDGSNDDTESIIQKYALLHDRIKVYPGRNLGVVKSFFELMRLAPESEFIAFADQDDLWKPTKLAASVKRLREIPPETPGMYYSRLEFVDEDLNHIGLSAIPTFSGFHNAVVQNQATGCTVVLNATAHKIIADKLPEWALMHDWWCYLVVSAFGITVYDTESHILYRKHGKNVTPATPFFALELLARVRRYLGDDRITEKVTDQVREFKRVYYDELGAFNRSIIDEFLEVRASSFFKRVHYVLLHQRVKRNTRLDNLILKVLIIAGRF